MLILMMMKRLWIQIRQIFALPQLILLATAFLVALGTLAWYYIGTSNAYISDPVLGTSLELKGLRADTSKLQASFNETSLPKASSIYYSFLDEATRACSRVQHYHASWHAADSKANAGFMNQSLALCQDMTKLVSYSHDTFTPLKPLLLASTTPRRVQTLPPFAGHIHHNHEQAVATAMKQIGDSAPANSDAIDFASDATSNLKQLQLAMRSAQGLSYLPALHTFQMQMMAERQRFWVQYAGIDSLQQSLEHTIPQD